MPNYLKDQEANVIVGLGTYTYVVAVDSLFYVSDMSTVIAPSSLSVVINRNGSPVASSLIASLTETVSNLSAIIDCDIGDVITVVISSAAPNDNMLNTVKSIVVVRQGQ